MLEQLKDIVEFNDRQKDERNKYTIDCGGIAIHDFFMDEAMIYEVEPIHYYGEKRLKQVINEYQKRTCQFD